MGLYGASDKDGRFIGEMRRLFTFLFFFFYLFVWADDLFVSVVLCLPPMHTDFLALFFSSSISSSLSAFLLLLCFLFPC